MRWRRVRNTSIAVLALGIASVLALTAEIRTDTEWIDYLTGSRRQQTEWPFGITGPMRTTVSPIERRYRDLGIAWQADWHFCHAVTRNALGMACSRACGETPPSYDLQISFTSQLSDAEVRQIHDILTGRHPTAGSEGYLQRREVGAVLDAAMTRVYGP